jgi:dipicolinate synthase subunit A
MDWCTVIVVTDKRQAGIGGFLPGTVESCRWSEEENSCRECLRRADCVVLPTPTGTLEGEIAEQFKKELNNCTMLFGGKIDAGWSAWCKERDVHLVDFMEDETVAQENAKITAEATAAEILKHTAYSVRGQKIIVTGYGRCGKAVADLLGAMGAKVTVFARSRDVRIQARRDGHDAVDFSYGPEEVYGAYTVVNTVPACVLTETIIAEMHKDTVIFDIASLPGGTDLAAAEKYHIPVIQALGLPGKYTTKSSAKILADAMQRQMLPRRSAREGKSWIFQIII